MSQDVAFETCWAQVRGTENGGLFLIPNWTSKDRTPLVPIGRPHPPILNAGNRKVRGIVVYAFPSRNHCPASLNPKFTFPNLLSTRSLLFRQTILTRCQWWLEVFFLF